MGNGEESIDFSLNSPKSNNDSNGSGLPSSHEPGQHDSVDEVLHVTKAQHCDKTKDDNNAESVKQEEKHFNFKKRKLSQANSWEALQTLFKKARGCNSIIPFISSQETNNLLNLSTNCFNNSH